MERSEAYERAKVWLEGRIAVWGIDRIELYPNPEEKPYGWIFFNHDLAPDIPGLSARPGLVPVLVLKDGTLFQFRSYPDYSVQLEEYEREMRLSTSSPKGHP